MSVKSKPAEAKPPALDVVIRQLGDRRKKLDSLDDRLGQTLRIVEEVLRRTISVRVHTMTVHTGDSEFEQLAWTKLNGKWQLVFEQGHDVTPEEEVIDSRTPLTACSREIRATMFAEGAVERLIHSAISQVETEIKKREQAWDAAERLLLALGPVVKDIDPQKLAADDDIPF